MAVNNNDKVASNKLFEWVCKKYFITISRVRLGWLLAYTAIVKEEWQNDDSCMTAVKQKLLSAVVEVVINRWNIGLIGFRYI
jgi:hypothetical protein